MLKIYHTQTTALISDERNKVYWYASKTDASQLAKGIAGCSVVCVELLDRYSSLLQDKGYREVKL